jgi:hypothetical protein
VTVKARGNVNFIAIFALTSYSCSFCIHFKK